MISLSPRTLRLLLLRAQRWLWQTKALSLRALLCLAMGAGTLFLNPANRFDTRFQIRGPQETDPRILIINISSHEWTQLKGGDRNLLKALKEYATINDQYFWNPDAFARLMEEITLRGPRAVGVNFFFPPDREGQVLPELLADKRIVWAAKLDADERPILPAAASNYGYNVGTLNYPVDEDGVLRRFSQPISEIPHFAIRLAQIAFINETGQNFLLPGESRTINYRGPNGTYPAHSLTELIEGGLDLKIKGKIVILGSRDSNTQVINTPFGNMSSTEVMANVVDNFLNNSWIVQPDSYLLVLFLAFILTVGIWLLFSYPQSATVVFLFWLGTAVTALSLWVFDSFSIWIPILPPLAMLAFTYVLFLGYLLTLKDNLNWRLEQEKKYVYEVEQLKQNFVSLISHDLKTPIAKIQAICDRLMSNNPDTETSEGLRSLRRESSELHRYIQSILRVSRVESKDLRLNKEAADINEIIDVVVQQVQPLAQEKNLELVKNLEPIFSIELDSVLIQEVILNLVENAVKYTPLGGRIEVRSQELDDQVIISVKDNGKGIAQEDQQKIFEKFYRGQDQQLITKGTGIGLYLVKYFIELHGGQVFLESTPGAGTRIGFRLPLYDEDTTHLPLQQMGVPS
jgi:two-component system phosphate regulon sensor histidine kinase PhoR